MSIAQIEIEHQVAQAAVPEVGQAQILIIARSTALLTDLSSKMASDSNVQGHTVCADFVDVVTSGGQNWDLLDFVVFEIGNDPEAELNALRKLKCANPERLRFVAVSTSPVCDDAKNRYVDAGVAEVLELKAAAPTPDMTTTSDPTPTPSEEGASLPNSARDGDGDVTVVLRARGGAGATTVAVNLAIDLAARGQPGKVALVDLDLQNGSIGLALDLPDSSEATAFIRAGKPAEPDYVTRAMQRHKSGVDVLTAPDILAPLSAMSSEMVSTLIQALKARYDHVILDLPQAVLDWTDAVLDEAARALIVTDMTVPSVRRTRRLMDLIGEDHMTLPIRTVINFEKRPLVPSQAHKEAAHLIGRTLDHWIPDDPRAARRAIDMGVPMRLGAKRSRASKAISALTQSVFVKSKKG
ncbi:AAA family ATPase [Antarctobacter sp.]|uniref:AAA family ATPase n=1 Tax=Antarctobacter sp. TaxID=1872577 RepID=UPI003A948BF6